MTEMVFVSKGRVKLVCPQCQQEFVTFLSVATRPGTHCCSMRCEHQMHPRRPKQRVRLICAHCSAPFDVIPKRANTARYCSRACANAHQVGENAANYKHGESGARSSSYRTAIAIRVREEGCCERCGATENLHGHHIKSFAEYPELRNNPSNIEVLCGSCHAAEHPNQANMLIRPRVRSGKTHACLACGAPFYVKPSHEDGSRKFCSRKCAHSMRPPIIYAKHCVVCGTAFTSSGSNALFCCAECKARGKRRAL